MDFEGPIKLPTIFFFKLMVVMVKQRFGVIWKLQCRGNRREHMEMSSCF